jgi:CheY-like chemotaxis protein
MEGFENLKDAFDLCILDVMMQDGYTLAKEIREKKQRSSYYIPYCKIDERGCFKRLQGWS